MRLRVRVGPGRTERLQLEDNASTYGDLKRLLAAQLGLEPDSMQLSLNKSDQLAEADEQPLRTAGVKGGDLLHLLGPAARLAAAQPQLPPLAARLPATGAAQAQTGAVETEASPSEPELSQQPAAGPCWSLADVFARVRAASSPAHGLLQCATHAAALEAGLTPAWKGAEGDARFRLPPAQAHAAGQRLRYRLGDSSAECELAMTHLGGFLIVTAAPEAGGAFTATLDAAVHLAPGGQRLRRERELWIRLKDGAVGPALRRLRQALGLPDAAGLTGLPLELGERILGRLQAQDLLALRACCRALRSQAAADSLWRPLAEAEFPHRLLPADAAFAAQRGWVWVFRDLLEERENARREAEAARRRARRRFAPQPPFLPLGGPFGRRNPPGFRQIGGDYDRDPAGGQPFVRPFLGGGYGSNMRFC